jgi:hypothetical protein
MKVEIISISLLAHTLSYASSSGVESIKFEKKIPFKML